VISRKHLLRKQLISSNGGSPLMENVLAGPFST
jgi:hypothetical protein